MLIIDAHEDLAWNILTFQRDYSRSAAEIRQSEAGTSIAKWNGDTLLGYPDYQRGQVAVVFATLFAAPWRRKLGDWDMQCYRDSAEARKLYLSQLDAYKNLCDRHPDKFQRITNRRHLDSILLHWQNSAETHPVGLVTLMEGAEAIAQPAEVEEWWQLGVRLLGPAWIGNSYCGGTGEPGPLTKAGRELLDRMGDIGFILDLSHMDEKAALEAVDRYTAQVVATHANALALLKGLETNRHLSDHLIHRIIERNGVIGIVPFNAFLKPGWKQGDPRAEVNVSHVVAHLDYICQLAGDSQHAGIGTDFDGGFGWQSVPEGIDSIADLQKLVLLLAERGYSDEDIASIMGGNWQRILQTALPESD
jgi:membrane dipeptidase